MLSHRILLAGLLALTLGRTVQAQDQSPNHHRYSFSTSALELRID